LLAPANLSDERLLSPLDWSLDAPLQELDKHADDDTNEEERMIDIP
jgi:hypothetical protein